MYNLIHWLLDLSLSKVGGKFSLFEMKKGSTLWLTPCATRFHAHLARRRLCFADELSILENGDKNEFTASPEP